MAPADQALLREKVDSVVAGAGYDLEEITVVAAGRRRLLRVVIDSDHGVDLDDAAAVSRDISAELDALAEAGDPMGDAAYTLEVTSPGIGRPLTLPRHFRRARGRLLAITTAQGQTLLGRVVGADADQVDLLVGRSGLEPRTMAYPDIVGARVEVEFSAPSAAVLAMLGAETANKFAADDLAADETPADETPADDDPADDPDEEDAREDDER